MPKKSEPDVVGEVTRYVNEAISTNRQQEWVVIALLLALFLVGLGLLVYGAYSQSWQLLAPGGIIQMAIVFPLRRLISLREQNKALQILPQLMRLADTTEAKALAAELVKKLIEKV